VDLGVPGVVAEDNRDEGEAEMQRKRGRGKRKGKEGKKWGGEEGTGRRERTTNMKRGVKVGTQRHPGVGWEGRKRRVFI